MDEYERCSNIMKALSDPNRLRIMCMLSDRELCACKILDALHISQPTLSHHMKYLVNAELVNSRKEEKWTYYTCRDDTIKALQEFLLRMHRSKDTEKIKDGVREYYGKELKSNDDLRTNACCCSGSVPDSVKSVIPLIDSEILDKFYGCGSPLPPMLDDMTVLDLGCGTGRDVYIASKLVGENGHVIGVDMTPEQLEIARSHEDSQMRRFGYSRSNVTFHQGFIEDLASIGIDDGSIDVVISNCVINLSPEKEKVFSEVHRVLRHGGELYFSDVFCDRRVPEEVYEDPVIHGECLGGAMYIEDFRRMMRKVGFEDFRITSESEIVIDDPEMCARLGDAKFVSMTVRAFKLDDLEDICEDYGQNVVYDGSIPGFPDHFDLDNDHRFDKCIPSHVCGNTASMLTETRYGRAFTMDRGREVHYGKFENCGGTAEERSKSACGCNCC